MAGKPRVLVVEDESSLLQTLRLTLSRHDFDVEAATGGDERDKVAALDLGADDYLAKPFSMEELLARIRVALRHLGPPSGSTVHTFGDLTIDFTRRLVVALGQEIKLSPTEWELIKVFVAETDRVLTYKTLLKQVWGPAYGSEEHYLHVYVANLRKKLEADPRNPRHLVTEPGVGYRFRTGAQVGDEHRGQSAAR